MRKQLISLSFQNQINPSIKIKSLNQMLILTKPPRNILKAIKNIQNVSHKNIRQNIVKQNIKSSRGSQRSSRLSTSVSINVKTMIQTQNKSLEKIQKQLNAREIKIPQVSSKCWGVYSLKQKKFIFGKQSKKQIQVASLTKIMNLVTIMSIIQQFGLDINKIKVAVSQWASSMVGTTATLKKKDVVSLQDLIYGMMLPSGNDAAFQIGMIGGTILKLADANNVKKIYDRLEIQALTQCRSNVIRYLFEMNRIAKKIKMVKSKWVNLHGLGNRDNRTTIEDMCQLCEYAMQNSYIRRVINTKQYQCNIQSYFGNQGTINRTIVWQNTNKMLWKGWNGIKTGITPNAGPCLAASLPTQINDKNVQLLVIIANCESVERRWDEVQTIAEWATQKLKLKY